MSSGLDPASVYNPPKTLQVGFPFLQLMNEITKKIQKEENFDSLHIISIIQPNQPTASSKFAKHKKRKKIRFRLEKHQVSGAQIYLSQICNVLLT